MTCAMVLKASAKRLSMLNWVYGDDDTMHRPAAQQASLCSRCLLLKLSVILTFSVPRDVNEAYLSIEAIPESAAKSAQSAHNSLLLSNRDHGMHMDFRTTILPKCKLLILRKLFSLAQTHWRVSIHNTAKHPGTPAHVDQAAHPKTSEHILA